MKPRCRSRAAWGVLLKECLSSLPLRPSYKKMTSCSPPRSSSAVMPLPGHRARSPGAGQWWTETSYLKLNSLLPKFISGNFPRDEMLTQTSPSIRRHEFIAQGLAMWFGENTPVMQNCLYLLNGGGRRQGITALISQRKKNEIMHLSANWDCTWPRV